MYNISETQYALFMFTKTFNKYKDQKNISIQSFSNGLIFAQMLREIPYFQLIFNELYQNSEKVIYKLSNLKKLVSHMQNYIKNQIKKILKVNDIQLVEIAKNNSKEDILKLFEVIIAVLMQTPEKQDHIQKIMDLDQRSQQALVIVVQNAMQFRISDNNSSNKSQTLNQRAFINKIQTYESQNNILRQQINQLCLENETLLRQNIELKQKIIQCEEQIQKAKNLNIQLYMNNKASNKNQKTQNIVQTLKSKMINTIRQHELEIVKFNQQIQILNSKLHKMKQMQDQFIERQNMFQIKLKKQIQNNEIERKRNQEKDIKIKKLEYQLNISKNKIMELMENHQLNDLNLKIQLEKKQIRFKQLEKQVKTRIIQNQNNGSTKLLLSEQNLQSQKQIDEQQFQYLKIQVQKLRNLNRQLQKQLLKLKKKAQKIQIIESQKKKLQKIILDVSKSRDSQIQMLIVSLYDLRNQNIRMHQIICELKNK